jgi:DNA-binding GntR family transcriptional regulator
LLIEHVVLPVALFPDVSEDEWSSRWLTEIAPARGVLLGSATEKVTVSTASSNTAIALHISENSAVFILERLISTHDGHPAQWRRAECISAGLHYKATMT